jgi:flavin reductase (DIM6/NTAB) family NADH-FMN oxidoreductase RutF
VTAELHPVQAQEFTRACARFATGVAVASVRDAAGNPHGLTVSSFTSVSLDPPLVLVCIAHSTTSIDAFRRAKHFGVSVLAADQKEISDRFARKGQDRFEGVGWAPGECGVPLLSGALATFECAATSCVTAGDHDIFIGTVVHTRISDSQPLVYFGSKYRGLA